ncbi:MAG: hypothetical protein H6525_07035 [Actinobacteria bacterium]|nr:hypothetical protein [Actinomycetota bacterium]
MTDPRPSATVTAEPEDGLRPAVQALRRQWIAAVATFLLIAGLGMLYVLRIPTEYQAGAVVSFMPRVASTVGGEVTSLLVERYPEVVASENSIDAAAAAAGVDPAAVSAGLQAGIQPETLNLVFSTTLPTNDQAVAATQAIYDNLLQVNRTDPDLRAVPVSEPLGWGPTGASTTLWTAAVMIAAVTLAFTVALVADGLRRRNVTQNPS